MATALSTLFVLPASGWVTQMQSKYGVSLENMAAAFDGTARNGLTAFETMGYYWHWPKDADSNRGLGGGIQWAWDDALCKEVWNQKDCNGHNCFEDQFKEDFFFASFVTCKSIKASMHRAMQTWMDVHPFIHFIEVTEECRRIYGKVEANCSLVEVFITARDNSGLLGPLEGGKHPKAWGGQGVVGEPYPWGDPWAVCNFAGATNCDSDDTTLAHPLAGRKLEGGGTTTDMALNATGQALLARRKLVGGGTPPESPSDITSGSAAASATQYGRYSFDLRATNGKYQKSNDGSRLQVIETYGGIVSFNVDMCWYLDSAFCAPLHELKGRMGAQSAQAMLRGIAWGIFALAALFAVLIIVRVARHNHCFGVDSDGDGKVDTCEERIFHSMEEMNSFGVLPLLAILTCLVVPMSLEHNIFSPCWKCFDFEAAAVHEIGHILGLNHPDKMGTIEEGCDHTYIRAEDCLNGGFPVGCSSHNTKLASMDGINPFLQKDQPADLWENPWKYSVCDAWPEAVDAGEVDPDTKVRQSIMEAFTEHNPQTCLTNDDIESLYMIYPMSTGRGMSVNTQPKWNCNKSDLNIGWVRVLVYIGIPIFLVYSILTCTLSCLKHHEEKKHAKMEAKHVEVKKEAKAAKKEAAEQGRRATVMAEALEEQVRTEDLRVEERAQEMAAQMIQARMRGNMARQKTQGMMAATGESGADLSRKSSTSGSM